MPSFNVVNYSLRPNKSIQRKLVFDGVKKIKDRVNLGNMVYIGLGSIWFTDFSIAHKELGIRNMISMEESDIGYSRSRFNRPFKTVEVKNGISSEILPELLDENRLTKSPWMVWLDYDSQLNEGIISDLQLLVERLPQSSILLTTFNAVPSKYGKPNQRVENLKNMLGSVVPDDLDKSDCDGDRLLQTLGELVTDYLKSAAIQVSRPGGFHPAFRIPYRDGAGMVTVGGVLPAKDKASGLRTLLMNHDWQGFADSVICAPLLTLREAAVLQSELPRRKRLSRTSIRRLGFDLEDHQIRAFEKYYMYYPSYAEVMV